MRHEVPVAEGAAGGAGQAEEVGIEQTIRLADRGERAQDPADGEADGQVPAEPRACELPGGPEEQEPGPGDTECPDGQPPVGSKGRGDEGDAEVGEQAEVDPTPRPLPPPRDHEQRDHEGGGVENDFLRKEEPIEFEAAVRDHREHDRKAPQDQEGGGESLGTAGWHFVDSEIGEPERGIVLWPAAGGN